MRATYSPRTPNKEKIQRREKQHRTTTVVNPGGQSAPKKPGHNDRGNARPLIVPRPKNVAARQGFTEWLVIPPIAKRKQMTYRKFAITRDAGFTVARGRPACLNPSAAIRPRKVKIGSRILAISSMIVRSTDGNLGIARKMLGR